MWFYDSGERGWKIVKKWFFYLESNSENSAFVKISKLKQRIGEISRSEFIINIFIIFIITVEQRTLANSSALAAKRSSTRSAFICGQTAEGGYYGGHARLTGRNRLETFADVLPTWTRLNNLRLRRRRINRNCDCSTT